jgi:hypothetical protein
VVVVVVVVSSDDSSQSVDSIFWSSLVQSSTSLRLQSKLCFPCSLLFIAAPRLLLYY